jgi:hypothetical protein
MRSLIGSGLRILRARSGWAYERNTGGTQRGAQEAHQALTYLGSRVENSWACDAEEATVTNHRRLN